MTEANISTSQYALFKFFVELPKELKEQLIEQIKSVPEGISPSAQLDFLSSKVPIVKEEKIAYFYKKKKLGELATDLKYLFESLYILQLEENFDDENSPKYDEKTWIEVIKFLIHYAETLHQDFNIKIDVPKIYHAPKSSIDILWETSTYTLLINVLKNGENAVFYADNNDKSHRARGEFKLKQFNHSLIPLAKQF
jgi:hypothetical protein